MLKPEQIDTIFTEAHNADGSRGFRYIVARAIYAKALKDAAEVCKRIGRPAGASDGATYIPGTSTEAVAAILALGEEKGIHACPVCAASLEEKGALKKDAQRQEFLLRKTCFTGNGDGTCAM